MFATITNKVNTIFCISAMGTYVIRSFKLCEQISKQDRTGWLVSITTDIDSVVIGA